MIGESLRRARTQANLGQEELARRAGISRMTVVRIEAGSIDPRLSTLVALSRVLSLELLLVPESLRAELEGFIVSGGRYVSQAPGTNAPLSIAELAAGPRKGSSR